MPGLENHRCGAGPIPAGQVQATTSPKPGMVVSRPVSRCQRAAPTAKTIWTYTETVQWFTAAHLPGLPGQASRASREQVDSQDFSVPCLRRWCADAAALC